MPARKNTKDSFSGSGDIASLFDEGPTNEGTIASWADVAPETIATLLKACEDLGAAPTLTITRKKDALLLVVYHGGIQNKRYFDPDARGHEELLVLALNLTEMARQKR